MIDTQKLHYTKNVAPQIKGMEGHFNKSDGYVLYKYCSQVNGNILELGSYQGKSANIIGIATNEKVNPNPVICMDPCEGRMFVEEKVAKNEGDVWFANLLKNTEKFKNIKVIRDFSVNRVNDYPDDHFELIFIDALHDYESVKTDAFMWLKKVSIGGFMLFHDYNIYHPGVVKVCDVHMPEWGYKFLEKSGRVPVFCRLK